MSIIAEIEKINLKAAEDARKTWWCVASMGCLVKDHLTHREIAEAYVKSSVEWQQLAEFGLKKTRGSRLTFVNIKLAAL